MSTLLLLAAISLAGSAGAAARYLLDQTLGRRGSPGTLPPGTLAVNLAGAFAAGLATGWLGVDPAGVFSPGAPLAPIVLVGFLGAFTTFSTWMVETIALAEGGHGRAAAANLALTLVGGLALAVAGVALGSALGPGL